MLNPLPCSSSQQSLTKSPPTPKESSSATDRLRVRQLRYKLQAAVAVAEVTAEAKNLMPSQFWKAPYPEPISQSS